MERIGAREMNPILRVFMGIRVGKEIANVQPDLPVVGDSHERFFIALFPGT
jgi:hypothetical protein